MHAWKYEYKPRRRSERVGRGWIEKEIQGHHRHLHEITDAPTISQVVYIHTPREPVTITTFNNTLFITKLTRRTMHTHYSMYTIHYSLT